MSTPKFAEIDAANEWFDSLAVVQEALIKAKAAVDAAGVYDEESIALFMEVFYAFPGVLEASKERTARINAARRDLKD